MWRSMMRSARVVAIGLLAGGLLGRSVGFALAQANDYQAELAAAKRAGLPTYAADLKTVPPPASQNAAPLYRQLGRLRKAPPARSSEETDAMILLGRTPPTVAQIAKGRNILAQRKDLLTLIHQAAARQKCDFQRDWSHGPWTLTPEYADMRAATRWLTAESGLLLRDGKPIEAVRNMALGFRIAHQAASDPILMAYLVSVTIDAITLRGLENILYAAGDRPGVAEAVRRAIERDWRPPLLTYGLRGEIVNGVMTLDWIRKGREGVAWLQALNTGDLSTSFPIMARTRSRPMTPAESKQLNRLLDSNGAYLVHALRQIITGAGRPYPQAIAAVSAANAGLKGKKDPRMALAVMLLPEFDGIPAHRAQDTARASVLRAAAAVFAWRAKHGAFPGRLDQALSPAPSDPFDGKPLRYRREGKGFVVYSIGETGTFNGVAADSTQHNREAVFRHPMPSYLKQPPPAAR